MTTYKQIATLRWDDVRALCCKHGWYTKGTVAQYNALNDMVSELDLYEGQDWIDHLQRIAEDIKANSKTEYPVDGIMTAINLKCSRWFEEA